MSTTTTAAGVLNDKLQSKSPQAAVPEMWETFKSDMKLVNPNNKRK